MYVKILKKLLKGKSIPIGTYMYNFLDVVPYDGDEETPNFILNITTKNPFQSYCRQKMVDDIESIVYNKIRLMGEKKMAIGIEFEFNRMDPMKVFISQEKREELLARLNKENNIFSYRNSREQEVSFEVVYTPSELFVNTEKGGGEIYFHFDMNLRRFDIDGEPFPVIEKYGDVLSEFCSMIQDKIMIDDESYNFRVEIENIIYNTLEPEMQINHLEIYYVAYVYVNEINGIQRKAEVSSKIINFPEFE